MSELPDITSMTPADLRREIAERRGYRIFAGAGRHGRFVCMQPPSYEWSEKQWADFWDGVRADETEEEAWIGQDVPNWPEEPGAALALCQEIAWKSRQFEQSVTIAQSSEHLFMAYLINHVMDEMFYMVYVAQGNTPALALSRLALAALRTQGADDE